MNSRVNYDQLLAFANALAGLDAKGLQVDGTIHVPGAGYMTVEYDGINDYNTITRFEVDE